MMVESESEMNLDNGDEENMIDPKRGHVPLWALLPGLVTGDKNTEAHLRELGYFDDTPRGHLLRSTGEAVPTNEEAQEILDRMEKQRDVTETGREASEVPLSDEEKNMRINESIRKLVEIHQQEM